MLDFMLIDGRFYRNIATKGGVCEECSDIDDVIVFTKKGNMIVTRVENKKFIEKGIEHVAVFKKKF